VGTWTGWQRDILAAGHFPATKQNDAFLSEWQTHEGGSATFNPMNTTQPAGGTTDYNSVHVKNYPSRQVGAKATAQTLRNGYYPAIVAALQSGDPYGKGDHAAINKELGTWGTGGFLGSGGAASYAPPAAAPAPRARPSSGGGGGGSDALSWLGALAGGPVTAGEQAFASIFGGGSIGSLADIFKGVIWLMNPRSWLRMVEFVTGTLFMLLGFIGLAVVFVQRSGVVGEAATVASALPGPVGTAGRVVSTVRRPAAAARSSQVRKRRAGEHEERGRRAQARLEERRQRNELDLHYLANRDELDERRRTRKENREHAERERRERVTRSHETGVPF